MTGTPITRPLHVADVMTTRVISVAPTAPLKLIITTMLDHEISAVPVVDDGRLVGIVTEADLVAKEAYPDGKPSPRRLLAAYFRGEDPQWMRKSEAMTAGDVMTVGVVTVRPSTHIDAAARQMLAAGVKRLVVVDDEHHVIGIVSRRDLLRFFAPSDDVVSGDVKATMANPLLVPEGLDARFTVTDGVVALTGTVLHPSDARVVEGSLRRIPGVVDVEAHLVAREPEPSAT